MRWSNTSNKRKSISLVSKAMSSTKWLMHSRALLKLTSLIFFFELKVPNFFFLKSMCLLYDCKSIREVIEASAVFEIETINVNNSELYSHFYKLARDAVSKGFFSGKLEKEKSLHENIIQNSTAEKPKLCVTHNALHVLMAVIE